MVLTVLYSLAGLGIAIVNDFKSIEGDRKMGLQSLPVAFGVDTAKWICVSTIDVTQLGVAAYLFAGLHQNTYAAVLLGLILPQVSTRRLFICAAWTNFICVTCQLQLVDEAVLVVTLLLSLHAWCCSVGVTTDASRCSVSSGT